MANVTKKTQNPPCPHVNECSGCPLMFFDYQTQLEKKREKVAKAFSNEGLSVSQLKTLIKAPRSSPTTLGYRNKAKLILETINDKGEIKMGIYKRGTHEVVDIPHCMVHAPMINEVANFARQQIEKNKVLCKPHGTEGSFLRYLIIRYSFRDKKVIMVFVTNVKEVPGLNSVFQAIEAQFGENVVSTVQNINPTEGDVLLGENNRYIRKVGELTETMGKMRVPVGPLSFLQVNSKQAAYLYSRVVELMGEKPFEGGGLDLYSGVGLHAMHMAKKSSHVLAVEEVGPAALEGVIAVRRNKISNVFQICADAMEGINIFRQEWGTPEWVVLNPPRKGVEKKVLEEIAKNPPRKLVYVSCSPQTLARDIRILKEAYEHFQIKTIEPVDMFPQTDHVECIVLLENPKYQPSVKAVEPKSSKSAKKKILN